MPSERPQTSRPAYPASLIVHAHLTGKRHLVLRLLADTGATYTMIPLKAALAIGVDPSVATRRIPLVTVSAVEYTPVVTVASLSCLGHQLRHVEVACHDLPPQSAVDGLLGLNILMRIPTSRAFITTIRTHLIHA